MKKERFQQRMQKCKGLWDYYGKLYGNKMDNLEEMNRFLEKLNPSRLNQEEIEALKLKLWSKISPKSKTQDQLSSQENSIKHLEKN